MESHELLQGLIEATLAGSAGIVLVLVLRKLLRRGFGMQAAYMLWLLVPVAMLATLPAASRELGLGPVVELLAAPANLAAAVAPAGSGLDTRLMLLGLWLAGAVTCGLWLCNAQRAFRSRLGSLAPLGDCVQAQALHVGLPATLGLWRPQIVLPADFDTRFDAVQRALVLAHERRHVARLDPWANAVAALLRCLCWFNPLFHLAVARFRHDQELACDADVLAACPQQRRRYGEALLNTQLALNTSPLGCHFGFGHPLKERIAMLAKPVPTTKQARAGRALVAALMLSAGYAAWAAQPGGMAAEAAAANGITADIALRVDDGEPRMLRIVGKADQAFSVATDASGKRYVIAGTVSRIVHRGKPALSMQMRIDEDGKQVAAPKIVLLDGRAGSIQSGQEVRTSDGRMAFKGLRLDITLSDATAAVADTPAGPARSSRTLQPGAVDNASRMQRPPAYPVDALQARITGVVMLIVDVDALGAVTGVVVERSAGDARLDDAAVDSARRWKFQPPMEGGLAVAGKVRVPVEFAMNGPAKPAAAE